MSIRNYNLSRFPINQRVYDLIKDDIPGWAKKIGIKASTIRDSWFRNHGAISAKDIKKIADATGKSYNWLITGKHVDGGDPAWTFSHEARERYGFLERCVKIVNEEAKKGRSVRRIIHILTSELETDLMRQDDEAADERSEKKKR